MNNPTDITQTPAVAGSQCATGECGGEQQRLEDLKKTQNATGNDGDVLFCYQSNQYQSYYWLKIEQYSLKENSHDKTKPILLVTYRKPKKRHSELVAGEWEENAHTESYYSLMSGAGKWMIWNPTYDAEAVKQQALGLLDGIGLGEITRQLTQETHQEQADGQGIVARNSQENLSQLLLQTQERSNQLQAINQFMQFEMNRRQAALEAIQQQANQLLSALRRKVDRIQRMITTIELYLGIEEELHQLQAGPAAPQDTPITFRQRALYMDEEIAVRIGFDSARSFDFTTIETFDEWLLDEGNLDYIIGEQRGIIALKIRRTAVEYSHDPFLNAYLKEENLHSTYFLIRNGSNVYRIFTAKLELNERLFPLRNELATLVEQMQTTRSEHDKDKLEKESYVYRKLVTFLQGLLDRTTVFGQLAQPLNLFKLTERTESMIQFIYDDENLLADGRPAFRDWLKAANATIVAGSRILMTGIYGSRGSYVSARDFSQRYLSYSSDSSLPALPSTGIYQVEKAPGNYTWSFYESVKRPITLCIRYNPGDTVYGSWGSYDPHERKRRIAWAIDPQNDTFLLHYDGVEMEEVEYYLNSRLHRPNYLQMLPVLERLLTLKKAEAQAEAPFVQLVLDEAARRKVATDRHTVEAAVRWWKTKNGWKRAISKDDTKALRMIIAYLRRPATSTNGPLNTAHEPDH